jgi:hypothetical protein
MTQDHATTLARLFVDFQETGNVPDGLSGRRLLRFIPKWRLQGEGIAGLVALRKAGHPGIGLRATNPRGRHR